jgi:predicted DNA-binding transcriptional regulator AlpA
VADPLPRTLTPRQLADVLQVGVATVYNWHNKGLLPRPLVTGAGGTRCLRWSRNAVEAWLDGTAPAFPRRADRRA